MRNLFLYNLASILFVCLDFFYYTEMRQKKFSPKMKPK